MNLARLSAELMIRHRFGCGVLMVAMSVVAATGYFRTAPATGGISDEEQADDSTRPRLDVATDEFRSDPADGFLVVETGASLTPETVAALRAMVRDIQALDFVEEIEWLDHVPVLNAFGLAEPLLPPNDASPARFRAARRRVLQHPVVRGQLVSLDGRTLLMPIRYDWLAVTSDEDCTRRLLDAARRAVARFPEQQIRVRLTGRVPLYLAYREAFLHNQRKFQILSYSLVLILAMLLFRGIKAVLVVAGGPALGIFWTLGILQWTNELDNPLTSAVLPVLLTMVGITDGLHIMVHIRRLRSRGRDAMETARSAIEELGLACALTSLTTAIGFASLMLAHSEFVQGFGRSCALGVVVTFLAVVSFIPLVSSTRFAHNIHVGHEHDLVEKNLTRLNPLVSLVMRRSRGIGLTGILATLVLGAFSLTLRPDDTMRDSQPSRSEPYEALAHCDRALGGIEFVRIVVQWPSGTDLESPQIMDALADAEQLLDREPLIQFPVSISNILKTFPGDRPVRERLPFLQLVPESVKQSYFNAQRQQLVITARIQDLGIARYKPVFERVEQGLKELAARYPGFAFELRGDPVHRVRNLHRIVLDLASSLGTASVIIFTVMTIVYRSLRIGLISVVPNMFPLVVTATWLVLIGAPLDISSVCAFVVCLGIAVDDSVHFLTRYQHELKTAESLPEAIQRTFVKVGTAMVISTMILVTGFGTVLTSDLPGHRVFASMACATITAALIGDLLFLPALLVWFGRGRKSPGAP